MATRCVQYTLVGFSAELDWRPLCFVKPLPRNRVCSACGLVRRMTVLLPCGHTLCECCYGQCEQDGLHVCALDNYECQDEDVEWRDLSDEELLKREVKCWNQESGCQYVTTISGIAEHFQCECQHHTLCCPKCSASVLFGEMIAHLKSGVCNPLKPLASDRRDESVRDERVFFTHFREELSVQAREIKECMDRVVGDIKAHGERLDEISHAINTLKETSREQAGNESGLNPEVLAQTVCEITACDENQRQFSTAIIDKVELSRSISNLEKTVKCEVAKLARETRSNITRIERVIGGVQVATEENSKKALDGIANILRLEQLGLTRCMFFVGNVSLLQSNATAHGWAFFESEKVYLGGYCMSPGVEFRNTSGSVRLHARLRIQKGDVDDSAQWPFEHRIRISVMHPKKGQERVSEVRTVRSFCSFQRPTKFSNHPVVFIDEPFSLNDLISDGYLEDDRLRIKWEIVP